MTSEDVKGDYRMAVTRRGFCNRLLITSAALVVGAGQASSATTKDLAFPSHRPMKIEGAERMAPGSFLLFAYPNRTDAAILVRTNDGKYFAHGQKCSHLGCSVNFNREQGCLQCPCHLGAYDLKNGSVLHGPPRRPLDRIFLEQRGGEVWAVARTNDFDAFVHIAT